MRDILVVCPSRDRPVESAEMAASFIKTSTHAKLVFYLDDDQNQQNPYHALAMQATEHSNRIIIHKGPRLGANRSTNAMVDLYPSDVYGMVPDDVEFKVAGWDDYLLEELSKFKDGIGVVAPHTNFGSQVDMPFCTRGWVEAVGWFGYPNVGHYVWPSIIALLGYCIAPDRLIHADPKRFFIHHYVRGASGYGMMYQDCRALYDFMAQDFPVYAERVRNATKEVSVG